MESAKENTLGYWKKNQKNRVADSFADLIDESRNNSKIKVFKKYKGPVLSAIEYNKMLTNIKKQTNEKREKIKKQ